MRSHRTPILLIVASLLSACSAEPLTPVATVGLYLQGMKGQDPMRTLSVLTANFQRNHGMIFANTAELPDDIMLSQDLGATSGDPEWAAERGRLGWLVAPSQSERAYGMFPELKSIQLSWQGNEIQGDLAGVGLTAWVEDDASVNFIFRLKRENETGTWRIDAVDVASDSSPHARFIEYVIAPNFETVEFIRREAAEHGDEAP